MTTDITELAQRLNICAKEGTYPVLSPADCGALVEALERAQQRIAVKLPLDSLPKTEGFWSAIYDMSYQTNRKPHENWNVSLAFSEAKEIVEWLNEIMPFRPATSIKWEAE